MIVAIIFAHVWGVIQLAALGSLARTTRLRTLAAAMAAGLYACAAASLLIQVFLTRLAAWVSGASVDTVVRVASYTIDPFVEEIVKLLPLAGLLTLTVVKRQWSLTDCVLVGAATGSGFGLAEDFFRYGGNAARAISVPGGWLAQISLAFPTVPTPWNAVTSWLPAGAAAKGLLSNSSTWALNVHLVWSAIGGLAAGLMLLRRSTLDVWVGAALLFYVCGDHAAFNAHGASGWSLAGVLAAPFNVLRPLLWGLPIVALAVAWRLDRRLLASRESAHLLSAEQASPSRAGGTFEAALAWLPWSLFWVDGLVRLRRAALIARKRESPDTQALHQIASELRSRIDVALAKPRQALISGDWKKRLSDAIREPQTIAWIVLVTPSLLWFVVSSVPGLAWTQTALSTRPAWTIIRLLALPALLWLAWQTVMALRAWSHVAREPLGDVAAAFTLRLVSGVGALSCGLYAFVVAATANGPTTRLIDNSHILDALGQGLALTGLLMALLSLLLFPPGGLRLLALAGGHILKLGMSANLAAELAGLLGLSGIMLMAASRTGSGGTKSPDPGTSGKKPTLESNPKHQPQARGRASPEPPDAANVYNNAIEGPNGNWYGKNAQGDIYRYSRPSNGVTHWNGSTAGPNGIPANQIPIVVRRALGVMLK